MPAKTPSKTPKKSKAATPAVADAPAATSADPAAAGSEALYQRLMPEARKIPDAQVVPLRADVNLALQNARAGVTAITPHLGRLEKELPTLSRAAIASLSDLGLALLFAAGQVERFAPPPSQIGPMLSRASELRALLMASADTLALAGLLPAAAVARIHKGSGFIDLAGDCAALAALFGKHAAALRSKTPVTAAQMREAAELGAALLAVLRPAGAGRKAVSRELKAAAADRDRLWTLFARTWEDNVWRAGAWLFGRDVDRHVPPLQSRVAGKRAKKAPAAPADSGGAG